MISLDPERQKNFESLQKIATEEMLMVRHHETLRDRAVATFLTISGGLIAFYGVLFNVNSRIIEDRKLILFIVAALIFAIGLFGCLLIARHSERAARHNRIAGVFRTEALKAFGMVETTYPKAPKSEAPGLYDLRYYATQRHEKNGLGKFFKENQGKYLVLRTYRLWILPNIFTSIVGIILMIATFFLKFNP